MRVVYDIYGVEFARDLGLTLFLAALAGFTIVYGSVRALSQDDLKKRLAYSTVSQLGIISASVVFALAFPDSWEMLLPAIVFFAMHHGFAKATLFFSVGLNTELQQRSRVRPFLWLLVLIPAVSLIGLPLTSGAFAKTALKSATSGWSMFSTLLVLSSVGTTLLMACFIQLMTQTGIQTTLNKAPRWGLILPTMLSALLSVSYVYITPAFEFKTQLIILSTVSWSALWPGIIGNDGQCRAACWHGVAASWRCIGHISTNRIITAKKIWKTCIFYDQDL